MFMTNAVVHRNINHHRRWCQAHDSILGIWFPVSKPQMNELCQIIAVIVDSDHQTIQTEPCNRDAST
jgi:hypothetical protein